MRRSWNWSIKVVAAAGLLACAANVPAQQLTNVAPRAEQLLRSACQYLAETPYFGLSAEIWREHIGDDGEKLQFVRQAEMQVKRPGKLHAEIHSPHSARGFWFDGKSLTILDRQRSFYSSEPISGNLDSALDQAREQLGVDLPLVDLAVSDPYRNAMAKVTKGIYLGLSPAMGYTCHHLAFVQDNIDWQVWIQDGPQPLIRKFVITHKKDPGSPEFTALITSWDMSDRIAEADFVFEAPVGARKVQMRHEVAAAAPHNPAPTGRLASPHDEAK